MPSNALLTRRPQLVSTPKARLSLLFRQMDANGDRVLTWDEYISYIIRHTRNNLLHQYVVGGPLLLLCVIILRAGKLKAASCWIRHPSAIPLTQSVSLAAG